LLPVVFEILIGFYNILPNFTKVSASERF
jgi:hypothetical protein